MKSFYLLVSCGRHSASGPLLIGLKFVAMKSLSNIVSAIGSAG
jgi:hypothetical protein